MGIRLVTFYNSTVTPQDDALIYENSLPASGMIYGGNVTIKNANTLHITAGHGALCGRKFTIEEDDIPIVLTSSGTLNGRLYIHMDLSDTGEPISLEVERANSLTPVIQQSNVNITDGIYEINLATFTISTSTVSDLVYVAPFIKDLDLREVIIAPVETSVASSNYAVGKHLIMDKVLYVVTSAITAGQTITPGTNVAVSDTVEKQIENINGSISTINTTLSGKVNSSDIANNLTTTAAGKVLDARQGKALNDVLVPKANQTVIATRQTNLTASRAYKIGDQFIYNNILYRATAAISSGGTITINGNAVAADNVTTQISNLASKSYVDTQIENTKALSTSSVVDAGWGLSYPENLVLKIQRLVLFNLVIQRPNGQDMIPNAYTICNFPVGYRPLAVSVHFVGRLYKGQYVNETKPVSVEVAQTGSLKLAYGITTTGYDCLQVTGSFFTS